MVLSQLRTFTAVSDTSVTMPFTIVPGMAIQSPTRSMSLADSCNPATKPRIESLKINISAAANAPSPVSRAAGDRSTSKATDMMAIIIHTSPLATLRMPLRGKFLVFSLLL